MANDAYSVTGGGRLRAGGLPRYPTWRPAPGSLSTLTVANGGLANHYRDVIADYYEPFYSVMSVNDYSGAFKNPWWGPYGACVFWGGGHAGCNHNAVIAAEYLVDQIRYTRLCDPTPWFGTGTDLTTQQANGGSTGTNAFTDMAWMDSTIDGKPGAPHSYGSGDFIGPAEGGATYGTFLQIASAGVNRVNDAGVRAAHRLDFATTEATQNPAARIVRNWARDSVDAGWWSSAQTSAPIMTAWVPSQRRVYLQANTSYSNVRWYDVVTKTGVTGSGSTFLYDAGDGFDSGIMVHVPSRKLLLCMYPSGSQLRIEYMDLSVAQPTRNGIATLSSVIAVSDPWSAGTWVPDAFGDGRIVIGKAGESGVYEIQIPATLSDPWPVVFAAFGGGGSIPFETSGQGGNTYKKWEYDRKARCIVYQRFASHNSTDSVYVYTPRGL